MRLPIVQGENAGRAKVISVNSCENMYPEIQKPGHGKTGSAFRPAPGYELVSAVDSGGECECMHVAYYDGFYRLFLAINAKLYEMDSNEAFTNRGTIVSADHVNMASGGSQLLITCGQTRYVFDMGTNTLSSNLESYSSYFCVFYNGYFLREDSDTGRIYFSNLYDATTWNALDYITAEYESDKVVGIAKTSNDILWIICGRHTELWQPTGDSNAPFGRINGAVKKIGCDSDSGSKTIAVNGESVFWLGNDVSGRQSVYMSVGYDVRRISTPSIEYILKSPGDETPIYYDGFCYSYEGHSFYQLSFGYSLDSRTVVYDITTDEWHLRTSYDGSGYSRQFAVDVVVFNKKYYAGHYDNNNIYKMSEDYLDEAGVDIRRQIITNTISDENKLLRHKSFEIDIEKGQIGNLFAGTALNAYLLRYTGSAWTKVADTYGSETYIVSLAVLDGELYGGTYPNGFLLKDTGTAWTKVADTYGSETNIFSLAVLDGELYGGTYPNAYLLKFTGSAWTKVADTYGSEIDIQSLAVLDGELYGGTAPNGFLLKYTGSAWTKVADTYGSETNIRSLAVLDGELYGGTSPNAYLLKFTGSAWTKVADIYGSETQIRALAVLDNKIDLYISNDGGHTYGDAIHKVFSSDTSASDYYTIRARWPCLGSARNRAYKIIMTRPAKWYIAGAYVEIR